MTNTIKHPAKFTNTFLPIIAEQIQRYAVFEEPLLILDPFAGTGKIFELENILPGCLVWANELEPEWAVKREHSRVGDALNMSWAASEWFTVICTSPTYGNRMADKLGIGKWAKTRNSYACSLGKELSENNSGGMQWGDRYRNFHIKAWKEADRVLCKNGLFILNISNHIRAKKEQFVSEWHRDILLGMGYALLDDTHISTPRQRRGANADLRVEYEHIYTFRKHD
jgi:hypothetical protein